MPPPSLLKASRPLSGQCWRVVEAQHVVSTMTLVDTLEEQHLLEQLLEGSKPPVPPECRRLHYLLSTPFRYAAPYPSGSRFRRPGHTRGVFYASRLLETAVAEMAFRRLLFYAESPSTPWPDGASAYTAFAVRYRTTKGLDLSAAPLARDKTRWTHATDYTACQDLADSARDAGIQVLRYASARSEGQNVALLTCSAFASREPLQRQVWRMHLGSAGVRALGDHPDQRLEFGCAAFASDPRIAALNWRR